MSDYERNKGKLLPIDVDTEHFTEEEFNAYRENGFMVIHNEVYKVVWEVERFMDYVEFADVEQTEDGTIHFHALFYNGGTCLEEVIEDALDD
jgi:hypothetical protein